jgi:hypothetical protein
MRLVRLLLVLAVALAVPLQGFAAVAAGQCMAFGHHEGGMAAAHGGDAGHATHESHADGHESHADGHESHHQPQDSHHGPQAQDSDSAGEHCAPCVACCAAAAISSSFQPFVPDSVKSPLVEATGTSYSGIAPGSLDRPPLFL